MTILTADQARLRLAQYLSPAFPVGGFAWSQGLEWAMDEGIVTRATFPQWLADWRDYGSGWTDAVLVSLALHSKADYLALDDLARAACISSQRQTETIEQGTAFALNVTSLTGQLLPVAALPVVFGRACADFPLPETEIIAAYLQAQTATLISAAVRFMPLGPVEGQAMLADMQALFLTTANRAASATTADLASATWGADIAAMRHETMQTRMFRS